MHPPAETITRLLRYKPASRLGRFVYRTSAVLLLLLGLGRVFKEFRGLSIVLAVFLGFILLIVLLFMALRTANRKLLWKVRNRLILTYLLMGLAPVVLFGTITGIAGYVFAGQYATNSAISVLDETERRVQDEANTIAVYMSSHPPSTQGKITMPGDYSPGQAKISLAYLDRGVWRALPFATAGQKATPSPFADHLAPAWLQHKFDGTISVDGKLYLCSLAVVSSRTSTTSVLGSIPVEKETLDSIAAGLGRIMVMPGFTINRTGAEDVDIETGPAQTTDQSVADVAPILRPEGIPEPRANSAATRNAAPSEKGERASSSELTSDSSRERAKEPKSEAKQSQIIGIRSTNFNTVTGGSVPPSDRLLDLKVLFSAPIPVISWANGDIVPAILGVVSRPTLLYTRLFATSVNTGSLVRIGLIVIAILFALLELFSLVMAVQLSRTITDSVAELYKGTTEIDGGNLAYRVNVQRSDQLGALSHSFNAMAASIEDLLVQQRERDRLLNELMIAQEVQKNLFPASPIQVGNLVVHALCMPARTVSGDYYDYIRWDEQRLCIALGDISGKGISAALLMASLSSAVRAFTLGSGDGHKDAPSPASLLNCLNRHLYRSTTPEKYATLFLAFFDSTSHTLTYSNGGHLPPLILSKDGTVRRLECGGSVVGLLDNLQYEEATVELSDGDLIVVYSDGLTEPERGDEEFGEDRLRSFVEMNESKGLDLLTSETIGAVKQWIGDSEQPDDMTILLARFNQAL